MTFTAFDAIYAATAALLPAKMDSLPARALLVAIALQESRFVYRFQIGGPAHGFWMFEFGGIRGVLAHPSSRIPIRDVLDALCYDHAPDTSYAAVEHNDVLACAFARLLLWTLPDALPAEGEADEGWSQYLKAWRPGKPHRETWDAFYREGWKLTEGS